MSEDVHEPPSRPISDVQSGLRLDELLREVQQRLAEVVATRGRMQGLLTRFSPSPTAWSWTPRSSALRRPP